jgi:enoyl-CoA hydratase/carnithine racemase
MGSSANPCDRPWRRRTGSRTNPWHPLVRLHATHFETVNGPAGAHTDSPRTFKLAYTGIRAGGLGSLMSGLFGFTMSDILLVERDGNVVRLTLNRPEKRNALSFELLRQLEVALSKIAADPIARVVVLGATGPSFCSGHDLAEMVGRSEDDYRELFALCTRVMLGLRKLPQPVIARVQGIATAAGCQIVAACDLAVAAEEATFATPGVKIGLFCTTPMVPLVRAIPTKPAMEMLLTGVPITAHRALDLGLVNRVVTKADLDQTIKSLTDTIASMSPLVIRTGKQAFYAIEGQDEPAAYDTAVPIMVENALFRDAQEGIDAFLRKRAPEWSGT